MSWHLENELTEAHEEIARLKAELAQVPEKIDRAMLEQAEVSKSYYRERIASLESQLSDEKKNREIYADTLNQVGKEKEQLSQQLESAIKITKAEFRSYVACEDSCSHRVCLFLRSAEIWEKALASTLPDPTQK